MQQAMDFLAESRVLHELVCELNDDALKQVTQFKAWTIEDVIGHLYFWNHAALLSLSEPASFQAFFAPLAARLAEGASLKQCERETFPKLTGRELVARWAAQFEQTADAFAATDPSLRVAWAGPSMSARSSISARQMETWAHGQAVFDVLGVDRVEDDRLRNIVVLGVNTFKWTFQVRGETPPEPTPEVVLTAPSGDVWQYGEPQTDNRVSGSAVAFAQVVTQTRSIGDTTLNVIGEPASQWMAKAQCFAGGANPPPAAGSRFRVRGA